MLYVFYEMGWRDIASLCFASPLAHSDKSKLFQNFAALRRTPEYVLFCKTGGSYHYSSVMKIARPKGLTNFMAGMEGFEPPDTGTRNQRLTTWPLPIIMWYGVYFTLKLPIFQ